MHERERHRIILSAVQEKPVITIQDLVELTEASEATLRRDIASLHMQGRIKRVRGGAEAIHPRSSAALQADLSRFRNRKTRIASARLLAKLFRFVKKVTASSLTVVLRLFRWCIISQRVVCRC